MLYSLLSIGGAWVLLLYGLHYHGTILTHAAFYSDTCGWRHACPISTKHSKLSKLLFLFWRRQQYVYHCWVGTT
ncbi:hypothetical protein ACQKWADRAFT_288495 [Trichoderma austrokoningii]